MNSMKVESLLELFTPYPYNLCSTGYKVCTVITLTVPDCRQVNTYSQSRTQKPFISAYEESITIVSLILKAEIQNKRTVSPFSLDSV